MPLTGIGAAERPHTEVRAGLNRSRDGDAREGMYAVPGVTTKASRYSAPPSVAGRSPGRRHVKCLRLFPARPVNPVYSILSGALPKIYFPFQIRTVLSRPAETSLVP